MAWRLIARVLPVLLLILAPLIVPITVHSQPQKPPLDWSLFNNTLLVNTDNYNIQLDGRAGGIVKLSLMLGQIQYDLLNDGEVIPIPLIDVVREGNQPEPIYRTVGNRTYELTTPGSLSLQPWTIEVVYNDSMKLVARLTPSGDALRDIQPLQAYAEVTFYSWTPIIDYKLVIQNDGTSPETLIGRNGGATIGILVNDNSTSWRYLVNRGGTVEEVVELNAEWGDISSVALIKKVQDRLAFVVSIQPLEKPERVKGLQGIESGNYTRETAFTLLLDMGQITLQPGDQVELEYRIAYIPAKPLQLAQVELLDEALQVDPKILDDVRTGFNFLEEIQNLNNTVQSLRDRVNNLQKTVQEKDRQLQELQGCEDFWKTELNALKERVNQLQERVQSAGLKQVASFIVGLLLGFIGLRYAFR
ncbi:MAG: hypothetical protein F7B18_00485 [Desulfurococcales archaeon]|nr:hypothetical protein [Desulfurococcales archaeon]